MARLASFLSSPSEARERVAGYRQPCPGFGAMTVLCILPPGDEHGAVTTSR